MPTDPKFRTRDDSGRNASDRALGSRLESLVRRARLTLVWEGIWPRLVPVLSLLGLFLTVSWLGLWINIPRWGRVAGLAAFALALLAALMPFRLLRWPSRARSLARIDRDSALEHRPATTLDDQLAGAGGDPETRALWRLHQKRAMEQAAGLKVGAPSPRVPLFDRYAVRAGVLVAVVAAAFVAGPEKYARFLAAFDWRTEGSVTQGFRMDAWIDPPAYTGRPPLLLRARTEEGVKDAIVQSVRAPAGSFVVVRASEGAGVAAEVKGGLIAPEPPKDAKAGTGKDGENAARPAEPTVRSPGGVAAAGQKAADQINRWQLKGDGVLTLRRLGRVVATYNISSIPDNPPEIALVGEPRNEVRGSMALKYKIKDDYGVLSAEAIFSGPRINGRRLSGRTLVGPPKMPLSLPAATRGSGEAETTKDLAEHPWAGAQVTMRLVARDEGGNTGTSAPKAILLPHRVFVKPLARALVEQRRRLVLAPDDRKPVETAFEALMIGPEQFGTDAGVYLGLYTIHKRLTTASNDEDLKKTADLIWEMALRVEEGDLTDAERALKAAQQALREALQRGASEEEIKRLMQQLRAAMDRFLRELAEQMMRDQKNQNSQNRDQMDRNRMITSQDLRNMLDQMEKMARNGNTADAQRMLDQLQRMLENLRSARRGQQQNSMGQQMNRALNQLDRMMRQQQQLRDRTYQEGQRQQGSRGDQRQDLQRQQEALRRQLEQMQRQMQQFGMQPQPGLQQAEREMKNAEQQMGKGQQGMGPATEAQRRALEGLRQGAQQLAQQMQQQRGPGNQRGQGDPFGPGSRDTANPDPLGREQHHRGDNSRSLFDPPGASTAQRAQRILEELRRRLSDPSRPPIEMDYLERLLRQY
ncbi:MAG: TIGR02302 family protein [Beijerinckiaceae bacterium]